MTPSVISELIRQKQLPQPFVPPPVGAAAPIGMPPATAPPIPEPGPIIPPTAQTAIPTPQAQFTPPPGAWVAPPRPEFQVPDITPLAQQAATYHQTEPQRGDSQFHQGKLSTILNVIASSLAGAGPGGAKAGIETAHTLRDIPFNRAHADWAQQAAEYDRQLKEEQFRTGVGEKIMTSEGQQRKAEITADTAAGKTAMTARGQDLRVQEQEAERKRKETQTAQEIELKRQQEARLALHDKMWQKGQQFKMDMTEKPEERDARILSLYKQKQDINTAQTYTRAFQHEKGLLAAMPKGDTSPENVDFWTKQVQGDMAKFGVIQGDKVLAAAVRDNLARSGVNINKLDAMTRDSSALAGSARKHIVTTLKLIDKLGPKEMGPIYGRWNDFMTSKVGKGKDFVPLRTNVELILTNFGRIHGGARGGGSKAMLEHFKSMADAGKMDQDTLRGALMVFDEWAKDYEGLAKPGGKAAEMDYTSPDAIPEYKVLSDEAIK